MILKPVKVQVTVSCLKAMKLIAKTQVKVRKNKYPSAGMQYKMVYKLMNLIITRNFPPDVGGMQNLDVWPYQESHCRNTMMVKVFADEH